MSGGTDLFKAGSGCGLAVALLAGAGGLRPADLTDLQQFVEDTKRTTPVKKLDPPPEIKPYTPFAYTAQGVKDPFVVAPFAQEEELEMTQEGGAEAGECGAVYRAEAGSEPGAGRTGEVFAGVAEDDGHRPHGRRRRSVGADSGSG
jgi:hypothetical protein